MRETDSFGPVEHRNVLMGAEVAVIERITEAQRRKAFEKRGSCVRGQCEAQEMGVWVKGWKAGPSPFVSVPQAEEGAQKSFKAFCTASRSPLRSWPLEKTA